VTGGEMTFRDLDRQPPVLQSPPDAAEPEELGARDGIIAQGAEHCGSD
jgi:hypothetical protein